MKISWNDYIMRAYKEASKLNSDGIKFNDMPQWIQFRIKLFNFSIYATCPKLIWYKIKSWWFYVKHPYLKENK